MCQVCMGLLLGYNLPMRPSHDISYEMLEHQIIDRLVDACPVCKHGKFEANFDGGVECSDCGLKVLVQLFYSA